MSFRTLLYQSRVKTRYETTYRAHAYPSVWINVKRNNNSLFISLTNLIKSLSFDVELAMFGDSIDILPAVRADATRHPLTSVTFPVTGYGSVLFYP
jgi:hypothetical protein